VLAPMGYSPNGGWGNHLPVVLANGTMPAPRPSTIAGVVLPRDGVDPEPAEADVYDAIAAVRTAYPIDPRRIYLAGNSMGGEGTWHLAQRRPDLWAAAAPGAGAIAPTAYPYARLGKLPVLAVHGDKDDIISYAASAEMIERLNRAGGNGTLLTVPGGGHRSFEDVLDQVFAFFVSHARKR
jgi:pimeloyl-ACP methyl ester carboxylesterase